MPVKMSWRYIRKLSELITPCESEKRKQNVTTEIREGKNISLKISAFKEAFESLSVTIAFFNNN